jgi:methyl-accepting chemotaxis protein
MLVLAAAEPAFGDVDLVKYAITQGGLLAVVIILLWSFRREFRRQIDEERERLQEAKDNFAVMTALVAQTNAAMQKTYSTGETQERAIHRLARAIEKLEDRKS